jgi:N-methylhydantoinase B
VNIARSTAVAACYVALKHVFTEVPANAGCLRPIDFVIGEDTFLGVSAPRPVAGYTETILRMIGVVFGALAQADPARATAAPFGTINALSLSGRRGGTGAPWVMFSFFGGGLGASPVSDGLNHGNNPISTATMPPLEILEASYPVMFTQWALRPDSAGPGAHRGGVGAIYEIEVLDAGGAAVALLGERGRHAPFGVAGGGEAALTRFGWTTGAGWGTPPMASKITGIRVAQGGRVRLETPGGGGWGEASQRDPAAVARDVARGLISAEAARRDYGWEG